MADAKSGQKRPRIRKAAPTVREKIESSGQKVEPKKPGKVGGLLRLAAKPLAFLWGFVKPLLRPLAPVGRLLRKVGGWLVPSYFINSWRELKKVTWPNRKETWRLTAAVFVFAIVFGALIAVVDYGLDKIFKELVLK